MGQAGWIKLVAVEIETFEEDNYAHVLLSGIDGSRFTASIAVGETPEQVAAYYRTRGYTDARATLWKD